MDPLFPPLPDDLAAVSDEDLAALITELSSIAERIVARDPDMLGDRTAAAVIAEMTTGVEMIEALAAERAAREESAEEAQAQLSALASRVGITAETEDDSDDGDAGDGEGEDETPTAEEPEVVVEEEPVPVAAAAKPKPSMNRPFPRRAPAAAPSHRNPDRLQTITASADIPGFGIGQEITDLGGVAEAMVARRRNFGRIPEGLEEKIPVATITRHYDDEDTLDPQDEQGNLRKIEAKTTALVAGGGLCAPRTPYYDLMQLSTDQRPVRDSLPRFNANRGGIRYATPPTLAAISTGVGIVTAAEDALTGTSAVTKTCQHIECPNVQEADVEAIYWCLQFGNLGSRTWPEQVAQFTELTMAAHARAAETEIIDAIATASTAVTGAAVGGAVNTLLGQILTAAAGYRSRHRMNPDTVLRVLLPEWADDLLLVDLIRSQFQRFEMTDAGVEALLRSFSVEPTYYIDGPTGGGQVFGAQGAGALLGFPTTCIWYMYAEGSFMWLDGGTLDLGLVRDSTLNASNDYSIFGETFEQTVFLGIESLQVTSTVCASGEVTLPQTVSCPVV